MTTPSFSVVEADLATLRDALEAGTITSVELVARYLNRIGHYDRSGITLNAVPVLNPAAFDEARASDLRRARGQSYGPLDGIPYTAKASYMVRGLPVTAGSPAFADLIAHDDAFAVSQLRRAGAICLGLTNMPPMAAGGMQRGLYGRAESPYNADYLTAAFGSGSSNGSGTATAASFAAFGLAEETWSSGRAPASNNSLVAYTPSRGVISVRGNWPLVPTMDVVVPHARSVDDLLRLLDTVVGDDPVPDGDLWRLQDWIELPAASQVRPESYVDLPPLPLRGLRFAVPRLYVNGDPASAYPIHMRDSVLALWKDMHDDLVAAGAEVVETDFPAVENYEGLHPDSRSMVDRGFVPGEFLHRELGDLSIWAFDAFLRSIGQPGLSGVAEVDGGRIFPHPTGALPDRYGIFPFDVSYDLAEYVDRAREGVTPWNRIPSIEAGMRGLEHTRRVDFEEWLAQNRIDAVIFPAAADVGPADADVNPAAADIAWRNGVWVSNGNLVPRHLGIPTVTIPMGTMDDTGMPVGLTLAGAAYSDTTLLQLARSIEALRARRVAPGRTPRLPDEQVFEHPRPAGDGDLAIAIADVRTSGDNGAAELSFRINVIRGAAQDVSAFVDGVRVPLTVTANSATGAITLAAGVHESPHSEWRAPYGPLIIAVARGADGTIAGAVATTDGAPL
ncbi:amidase [Mycolicibacterium canariasense]|uniref:Amidase n=1 Tax=Mycolicibacterium canariasense TaxID=228230 RepID=A0A124E3C5_MYCCR|nr:amidase [Mycolicibacterium canariasense]MCV7207216.1 amidase [Mycolicibacterium canariasense]ORV06549.1 amidase [Mycolicibacterium canariasense]GAS99528.1 amidase [Mycolicibacterium canariasense]